MTQYFLPRFTCFPTSYSLLWRCTHLMDHELINYQELNPQRVPQIHSQDGDPPSHEQSTRVANCDLPRRRLKNPSQAPPVWPRTITNSSSTPPLLQAIYGDGNHRRVTRNPQQLRRTSASRCKSLSNVLDSLNLTKNPMI
jgi:hypothetical protein